MSVAIWIFGSFCFLLAAFAAAWGGYSVGYIKGRAKGFSEGHALGCRHRWEKLGEDSNEKGFYRCIVCGTRSQDLTDLT